MLFGDAEVNARVNVLQHELGEYYPWFRQWEKLKNYSGVQARMGVEFRIK